MVKLGNKKEVFGAEKLEDLNVSGKPHSMPNLPDGHKVICGLKRIVEELFVCESVEEMQSLYDSYASGMAIEINWYSGDDPGFVITVK